MKQRNYTSYIFSGALLIFSVSFVTNLSSYLIRMFLSRSLTPEEFGLVYSSIALINLINIFRNFGMAQTIQKKIPEFLASQSYGKIRYLLGFAFLIQFSYALLILLVVIFFSQQLTYIVFQTTEASSLLILFAVVGVVQAANQVLISTLQGTQKLHLYTLLDLFNYALRFVLVLSFISLGVLVVPFSYLVATLSATIIGFILLKKEIPRIFAVKSEPIPRDLIVFSSPIILSFAISSITSNFDTVLLSTTRSLQEVALYQVALPIATTLILLVSPVPILFVPIVSELWMKKSTKILTTIIEFFTKIIFIAVIPFSLIYITFPELVIRVLFSDTYVAAAPGLQILSLALWIKCLGILFSTFLVGIGKSAAYLKITTLVAIVNVISNIILIPHIGITGAAVSLLLTELTGTLFLVVESRRFIEFRFSILKVVAILLGGILTTAIIFMMKVIVQTDPWIEVLVALFCGFLFYVIYILKMGLITKKDMQLISTLRLPLPRFVKKLILSFLK